jgi:hypothetical protein
VSAATREPPILVVGIPRSGTTWLARTIASHPLVRYVHEPDNHHHAPFATKAKRGLGAFPDLPVDARHRRFEELW